MRRKILTLITTYTVMNIKKLLNASIITTMILIAWGAVVRGTHSGLGCPDWPLCHGEVIPPLEKKTYIELTHRIIAAIVGFMTLFAAIGIWRDAAKRALLGKVMAWAIVLLVVQSVLGGMAVLSNLHAHVIAVHLGLAFIFLGVLTKITMRHNDILAARPAVACPCGTRYRWAALAIVAVFVQSCLGAIVSASYAGLACPDFPTCLGQWWPAFEGNVALHMMHRLGAIVASLCVGLFVWKAWSVEPARASLRVVLILLCTQVALGITNVLVKLALPVDVAHLAVAASLFAMLVVAVHRMQSADSLSQSHQTAD